MKCDFITVTGALQPGTGQATLMNLPVFGSVTSTSMTAGLISMTDGFSGAGFSTKANSI